MSGGERLLCEVPYRVVLRDAGPHVEVVLEAEPELRFESTARNLASALNDVGLQLSSSEGFCRFEPDGGTVRLRYARGGSSTRSCDLPAPVLRTALAWLMAF